MLCTSITTADQWFWSFLISRTTPYMITSLGYGTYMFFGALMVIMGFWALFFIPETKGMFARFYTRTATINTPVGLTLEDMDRLFAMSTVKTVWRAMIERRTTEDIVAERRQEMVIYDKKEEAGLEQAEWVDSSRRGS